MLLPAVTVVVGLVLSEAAPVPARGKDSVIRSVAVLTGTRSQVAKESFRLIETADEWKKVWEEHRTRPAPSEKGERSQFFEVDFDRHVVVAMFDGDGYQNDGYSIEAVSDGKRLTIRYQMSWVSIGGPPFPTGLDTTSYCFIVLPRITKLIDIEEDVRKEKPAPPVWKHRATLKPSKLDP